MTLKMPSGGVTCASLLARANGVCVHCKQYQGCKHTNTHTHTAATPSGCAFQKRMAAYGIHSHLHSGVLRAAIQWAAKKQLAQQVQHPAAASHQRAPNSQ